MTKRLKISSIAHCLDGRTISKQYTVLYVCVYWILSPFSQSVFLLVNSRLHRINGRAEDSKSVYKKENNLDEDLGREKIDSIQSWEEISTDALRLEILADSAPHSRLLISSRDGSMPFLLNARLSQLCLLLAVWDSNMQELGTVFKVSTDEIFNSARPPTIPDDFPEYSSEKFVSYLESIKSIRSEICCIFKKISIRCTFDEPKHFSIDPKCFQYFEDPDCADDVKAGLIISLDDAVIHVLNNHLNVKRIGLGKYLSEYERTEVIFCFVLFAGRVAYNPLFVIVFVILHS
jgi:hypothetical protein